MRQQLVPLEQFQAFSLLHWIFAFAIGGRSTGFGLPLTSWGSPSLPLTASGFQNCSRLGSASNLIRWIPWTTLDTLPLVLLLVIVAPASWVTDLVTYFLVLKMDTVMENASFHGRNVEKNTSFALGMQFEAEKQNKKTLLGHHIITISEKVVFHDLRWLLASYHSPCNNNSSKRLIHSTATLSTNTNPQKNFSIPKEFPTCPYNHG